MLKRNHLETDLDLFSLIGNSKPLQVSDISEWASDCLDYIARRLKFTMAKCHNFVFLSRKLYMMPTPTIMILIFETFQILKNIEII